MFSDPQHNLEQLTIDPGMIVADLGCGAGNYAIPAAKMAGATGNVFAVDVQQDLLTRLKTEAMQQGVHNSVDVVWGDIDEPQGSTLRPDSVDRVLLANILFQVEKNEALVTEAYRITKRGGLMLLIDWSDSFGGLGPQSSHIVPMHTARELCESAGFTFVRDITAGDHHYGMVFKK
jgi:ubiquinone/menaquinone biosynthesis C-methylase UbiE